MNSRIPLILLSLCLVSGLLVARAQDEEPIQARRLAELDALKKEHLDLAESFSKTLADLESARNDLKEARKGLALADKERERMIRDQAKDQDRETESPELIALREEVQQLQTRLSAAESASGSSAQSEMLISEQTAQINDLRRRLENTDADKLKWARERAAMERQMSDLRAMEQAAARRRDEEAIFRKQERDQRELAHVRALNDLRAEIAEERVRHGEVVAERDAAQARIDAMDDELERARTEARTAAGVEADSKLDLERALKQLSDAQSALASTSLELDTVKARNEEAVRDRDQAVQRADKIEALRDPDAREIQTLGEKVAALNRDVESARREAGVQQAAAEEAEARITALGGERKEIEERMAGLTDSLGQADAEVARQRVRAETAERDLTAALERAARAEEQALGAEDARTALREQAAQGAQALAERDADRNALAEAKSRVATLESERAALLESESGSRDGLKALGRKVADLTASLEECQAKCLAAEAARDQAVQSGDILRGELEQVRADLAGTLSLADQAKAALLQVETLTEQVKALQSLDDANPADSSAPLFQP